MRCMAYTYRGWRIGLTLLVGLDAALANGSRAGQDTALNAAVPLSASTTPEVCESRTINYITHTLPQQCLRTAWASASHKDDRREGITTDPAVAASTTVMPEITLLTESRTPGQGEPPNNQSQEQDGAVAEDLSTTTFMSFEEWKEMMLRKSGDPANIKARKQQEQRESKGDRDATSIGNDLDSLGDDPEISLDFDALSEKVSEITAPSSGNPAVQTPETKKEEQVLYDDGKTQYYRSKDAGKTCKERFSFSSFDAGATILKTNPGAKNAKAILVENKDSYMLLECRTKNKFVIVELSDDILVDTVVLANFEFFSSMIRKFTVSVSDRYPGKWLDLGTFEARNSRDIQPFLVEHPQIYTKYIRIEFLTHYGNEYYCPVSLLRVHGTRMLDTWKDPPESDEPEQIDGPVQEAEQIEPAREDSLIKGGDHEPSVVVQENATETQGVPDLDWSPWEPIFSYNFSHETCASRSPTTGEPTPVSAGANGSNNVPASRSDVTRGEESSSETAAHETSQPTTPPVVHVTQVSPSPRARPTDPSPSPSSSDSVSSQQGNSSSKGPSQKASSVRAETVETPQTPPSAKAAKPSNATTIASRNKTSATSIAAASPTVQESFFKSVTKRLQVLESNTTLSLQYIEEQSRFLQEVLLTIEKKQVNRVDSFLNTLNRTVLTELRNVRTQYDQIWQSTVIALETQREQSQREIVALSTRLNVLAEEVVFQKRMAILQSVLLLSCLILVIFSRGLAGPSLSIDNTHPNMMSPSPPSRGGGGRGFTVHDFNNSPSPPSQRSLGSNPSGVRYYYSDKALPLTPASPDFIIKNRSREAEGTASPIIRVDGVDVIVTPASPEFVQDGHSGGLEDSILMTPPSSRAISEEPLIPVQEETPKAPGRGDGANQIMEEIEDEDDVADDVADVNENEISSSTPTPESSPQSRPQDDIDETIITSAKENHQDEITEMTATPTMTTKTTIPTTTFKNKHNNNNKRKKGGQNHNRTMPVSESQQPQAVKKGGSSGSGAGASIGGRKPLPALPEDPS